MSDFPHLEECNQLAQEMDADVIIYCGDISRKRCEILIDGCWARRRRTNVILMLTTYGGDANAAYRLARTLQSAYKTCPESGASPAGTFSIVVNSFCKSAGTILALGSSELWMSPQAELGPIDIQVRKQDEVGEISSALTPIQAIGFLENESLTLFKRYFKGLRFDEEMLFSTKLAAEVSKDLTIGLLGPILSQIDPIRIAEVERSLRVATEYGQRLGQVNLHQDALEKLVSDYPSHGFVIDRKEAGAIFKVVKDPPDLVTNILNLYKNFASWMLDRDDTFGYFMNDQPVPAQQTGEGNVANDHGTGVREAQPEQSEVPEGGAPTIP